MNLSLLYRKTSNANVANVANLANDANVTGCEAFNYLAAHVERILQRLGEPEELEQPELFG